MNLTNASLLLLLSCSLTACSKTGTTQTEPESSAHLNTINQSEHLNQTSEPTGIDTPTQHSENVESNNTTNDEPTDVAHNDENNEPVNASEADVQVDTVDDSAGTDNTDLNKPDEPVGLKGVVYTDTEIELFWDRNTDTSVIEYTVKRDEQTLTTVDALSYYDNTVLPGTTTSTRFNQSIQVAYTANPLVCF